MKKQYVVLKLSKNVEYTHPVTGVVTEVVLSECAGYLPVFDTIEEAQKQSNNGKYDILKITQKGINE